VKFRASIWFSFRCKKCQKQEQRQERASQTGDKIHDKFDRNDAGKLDPEERQALRRAKYRRQNRGGDSG
jgi:hypothetical protein